MADIIEVRNFTQRYGTFTAVEDISFSVEEGSVFAFLGPNGAGKSTTINVLCTILEKTQGSLRIAGNDVSDQKDKVRKDIGIVFQESALDSRLTVEENLRFHCHFYGVPKHEVAGRMEFALDLVDLSEWGKAPVGGLSGGMKRRVEIAKGLVHFPRVLFLDEPTSGLDPQTRANVWEYIHKLQKNKNITIFLTTHYMDEAENCDKAAIIDHGRIVAYDSPSGLKKKHTTSVTRIRTRDFDGFLGYLDGNSMEYDRNGDMFTIRSGNLNRILEMAALFKESITEFETTNGTMNDVFLAITGKGIRV